MCVLSNAKEMDVSLDAKPCSGQEFSEGGSTSLGSLPTNQNTYVWQG